MIIKLKHNAPEAALSDLFNRFEHVQTEYRLLKNERVVVVPKFNDSSFLNSNPAIAEIIEIETPYQLASVAYKKQTAIDVKGSVISNTEFTMIAGPCSVESEEQIFETAKILSECGVKFIRGGAYKPRTSPYSFKGLGLNGLKLLKEAADQYHLRIVTEILDLSLLNEVYEYADILQVGSRNMQNFFMLNELGKIDKPVLLKRGMLAKITEWLLAAEYVLSGGNQQVILCERGIRSFDPMSRNVLDVGVIPLIKELSHLPVIADPSHGTGNALRVAPMALASVAAGANGLLIEIHPNPKKALSDSLQTINFDQFKTLNEDVLALLHLREQHSGILKHHTL